MNLPDSSQPVRSGEELDIQALTAYLQRQLPHLSGPVQVTQFPSGFSNLTYSVQVGETELVLRRPPFGVKIRSAHDMGREYRILSHLVRVYPRVPQALAYCDDESVLGAPFYLMQRVRGVILRTGMPVAQQPEPAVMTRIAYCFVQNLADLHRVDVQAAGLGDLGRPQGYVQRQIEGWMRRYANARTDDIPGMERMGSWLAQQMTSLPPAGATLIHNDYRYDNMILDPQDLTNILAVLDWEMCTLGDPLMDLGTTLGYWVEADDPDFMHRLDFSPTTLPGNLGRAALVQEYATVSGRDVGNIVFYYVYGLFKLAVIIQQIYTRYQSGHTQDPRFADLLQVVQACARIGVQAMERGRIDRLF